ncbi:MAG: integrase [Rheinheimera sp.]|nr:integrase [Rheinheimera sp.]|tara:strand:+ start:18583 stop:19797 length:1215 start_codon:yes stop_codon:yes gene_type:complete
MALTHTAVTNAKPKDKMYKLTDGGGLYLQIKPTGYKCFKYDYRLNGERGTYTIGSYPEFSLKDAREEHRKAREMVAKGIAPITIKEERRVSQEKETKRFSYYMTQWLKRKNLAKTTEDDLVQRIQKNLLPDLDKKPVDDYSTADLLKIIMKVSQRGAKETARRLAGVLRQIYNDILILGLVENNPAANLAELLPAPDKLAKKNFAHITKPEELSYLIKQIHQPSQRQDFVVTQALKLMPLLFLRPHNIRFLKWEYIDFDNQMIDLPASQLKTRKPLQVPLASQAIKLLEELKPVTGHLEYVFIAARSINNKPISESTTNSALQRIINPETNKPYGSGFMTSHGFRHTASTFLNELGFDPDVIELQLAHMNKDRIRATYNKAQLMEKRKEMMQAWADYLEQLRGT